jgi:hypothetical protein
VNYLTGTLKNESVIFGKRGSTARYITFQQNMPRPLVNVTGTGYIFDIPLA